MEIMTQLLSSELDKSRNSTDIRILKKHATDVLKKDRRRFGVAELMRAVIELATAKMDPSLKRSKEAEINRQKEALLSNLRSETSVVQYHQDDDTYEYATALSKKLRNFQELCDMIRINPLGVLAAPLKDSYPNAERDINRLIEEKKVILILGSPNKPESAVLFPAFERVPNIDDDLKRLWNEVRRPSACRFGLPETVVADCLGVCCEKKN